MAAPDVLVASLSGAVRTRVAVVREGKEYYLVAPRRLGGTRAVPADSLTDCLHASVHELGKTFARLKKKAGRKE